MAHIYRLICALVLACLSASAFASFPATQKYSGRWRTAAIISTPTPERTCTGIGATIGPLLTDSCAGKTVTVTDFGTDHCNFTAAACGWYDNAPIALVLACPDGSTLAGSGATATCTCDTGFTQSGSGETAICGSTQTTPAEQAKAISDGLNLIGAPLCFNGPPALKTCYAGFVITSGFGGSSGAGKSCIYPTYSSDGTTCTSTPDGTATPSTCKVGEAPGEVNGVTVCAKAGTTTTADGTKKDTDTVSNPDGSTTTTTKDTSTSTVCDGVTCTTTTTTTTTTGGGTGGGTTGTPTTTTTTTPQASFCSENPASSQCKEETPGTFSGVCGAAPSCGGDAVQCAQAEWAFKSACALTTAPTAADIAEYTAASARAAGDQTGDLEGNRTTAISASSFDQTELFGASAGMSDLTIVVAGKSITLPLSQVNQWLVMLGWILKGVTFVLCIRIVTRG